MSPAGGALAELAASVADGDAIDWHHAEAALAPADRRFVRHLRLVESISTVFRTLPAEEDEFARGAVAPSGPRWGRLILLDRIGDGVSGEVYRAFDSELHREVALKLLRDDRTRGRSRDRVLQEARLLARVRHEHIVHVYGAEEHDGRVGLWMELVRGESLEQIVRRSGPLGAREAAGIGQELCAALAAVHGAGLLHRDIKAQNVLREEGGRIVLMDFGTGEELRQSGGTPGLVGTPMYLAPEIFQGRAASMQSDVYSLGVLLFHLLTGQFPVHAPSLPELEKAHRQRRVARLRDARPDLPAPFVRAVERAIDRDPRQRYATAGQMEAALGEALTDPRPRDVPAPTPRPAPRRFTISALAAALLIVVALLVWSAMSQSGAVAPGPLHRIAVLPMADLSAPSSPPYLAAGLTDQLTSTLGQIQSLQVLPRSSVAELKGGGLAALAKALAVDGFVESSVVVSGGGQGSPERVRVNASVIAAGSGSVIWSSSFERPLGDMLALEAEIARSIARAVQAAITPAEAGRLDRAQQRRTTAEVERACFEGRYNLMLADRAQLAVDAFRRAAELDPEYAPAQAGLANSYVMLRQTGRISPPESRALALAAANRALALDPDSSEALTVLADLKFQYDWDWAGAGSAYSKALDLNGSSLYARTQYARFLMAMRRFEPALVEAERAETLDPSSVDAAQVEGLVHYYKRDYPKALDALNHAVVLGFDRPGTHLMLSRVHAASGALDVAIAENEKALTLSGNKVPAWRMHLLMLNAMAGDRAAALDGLAAMTAQLQKSSTRLAPEHFGYLHLALGDRTKALKYLEEAVAIRDPDIVFIAVDPRLDPLRTDARFQRLVLTLGLP